MSNNYYGIKHNAKYADMCQYNGCSNNNKPVSGVYVVPTNSGIGYNTLTHGDKTCGNNTYFNIGDAYGSVPCQPTYETRLCGGCGNKQKGTGYSCVGGACSRSTQPIDGKTVFSDSNCNNTCDITNGYKCNMEKIGSGKPNTCTPDIMGPKNVYSTKQACNKACNI